MILRWVNDGSEKRCGTVQTDNVSLRGVSVVVLGPPYTHIYVVVGVGK